VPCRWPVSEITLIRDVTPLPHNGCRRPSAAASESRSAAILASSKLCFHQTVLHVPDRPRRASGRCRPFPDGVSS
jgi:hypothetical protein